MGAGWGGPSSCDLRQSPGPGPGLLQPLSRLLWPRTLSRWPMWWCGAPCSLCCGMRPACQVRGGQGCRGCVWSLLAPRCSLAPAGELQALGAWFQRMTLSEACRKAAASALVPEALLELKSYLQKQPPPCLAMERATSNEPEVPPRPPAQPRPGVRPLWGCHGGRPDPHRDPPSPQEEEGSERVLTEEEIAAAAEAWAHGAAALPKPWQPPKPV